MSDENLIRLLRAQAWERAKGAMNEVRVSFHGAHACMVGQFDDFNQLADEFIARVENNGLAE